MTRTSPANGSKRYLVQRSDQGATAYCLSARRASRYRLINAPSSSSRVAMLTLVTSQLPVDAWHAVIDEPTIADAILDRLVHDAYRLDLDGPSLRKLKAGDEPSQARS